MRPSALDAATLEKLVSAAVAAPSMHNTRPWYYRLDPDTVTVEVRADAERVPRRADPGGRALSISAGAAVFNLRVAMAHFGWRPVVRLTPRPSEPDLLATLRPDGGDPGHLDALYEVLWRRQNSHFPFAGERLPHRVRAELTEAAHADGAALCFARPEEISQLLRITEEAERRNARDHDLSGPQGDGRARDLERRPTVAVLTTRHDRRTDWLRAGQALQHVLLVATALTARATLLHQALEWPDLRWALSDNRRAPDHVQMLIRLGYGRSAPDAVTGPAAVTAPDAALSPAAAERSTPGAYRRPAAPPAPGHRHAFRHAR
ncbi:hypothetical protein PV419_47700 [Streptomyces sp. ME19-01-6]|nr:hypothetical protein [Streptomyces sp. ME19-01-6]